MVNRDTVFVIGAAGNLGGAAAINLLNNGFRVKALTRSPRSAKADLLKENGAEIIGGNLDNHLYFSEALKDSSIFCVLTFTDGTDKEINRGKNIIDLAAESNVGHFIYSSVAGAAVETGIPHWDSKRTLEDHLKKSGLRYTIIRPGLLFESFLFPEVKKRILKGKLVSPVNGTKNLQYIAAGDIGKLAVKIFKDSDKYAGLTITPGKEEYTQGQAAGIFSKVLKRKITYKKMPLFLAKLFMGNDLYIMFKWINENDTSFTDESGLSETELTDYTSLEEWIRLNFSQT